MWPVKVKYNDKLLVQLPPAVRLNVIPHRGEARGSLKEQYVEVLWDHCKELGTQVESSVNMCEAK